MLAAVVAATPSPGGSPTPTPALTATASPTPPYSLHGAFSGYSVHTGGVTANGALTDVSNGMLTLSKNTGQLQGSVTVGEYALSVLGMPLEPTTAKGANTSLYGFVPAYDVAYVPNGNVTVSAGQLATLLGQEDGFTYQNVTIERGVVWGAEPTFSRGVRATYTNGKITGDLEYDDGYYSGNGGRAVEGLAGWAPTANTDWQFAFIVPGANTQPNVTTSVANKREFDFMLTQQFGKLQLEPYVLYVDSPASAQLGYTKSESALGAVVLADYAWNSVYSVGGRFESFGNGSAASDTSLNADLVGFGPGSRATTWTITPMYHPGPFFVRAEYSFVTVTNGAFSSQSRYLVELGAQF